MSVDQAYNFKKVNDAVSTAGVLSADQLGRLGEEGYEAVINLLPNDSEYAVENEASIVSAQGIDYEYIPVDFSAPTANDFHVFAEKLTALSGKKVMVHCAANYRVSAFYSIYGVLHLGWPVDEARAFMASIWNLDEYPVWRAFVDEMLNSPQATA